LRDQQGSDVELKRHHIIAAAIAIITALAFVLWYAPQIGFLAR
jgi:hypothetical protein